MIRRQHYARPARRSTTRRMLIMLLATGIVFGGIFGFKAWLSGFIDRMIAESPQPPAAITATEVALMPWTRVLEAVGTVVADNGVDVTTEAAGIVSEVRFGSGQPVQRGDVLVQLDTRTETASLRALEAALNLALVQRDRYRELFASRQAVARAELDQRESEAERLQAEVNAQQALIARKTIRAPFAGTLGIRRVNLGQYLTPGDPIVNLQSLDPVHVDFHLPEQQLHALRSGQAVDATVDALPQETFRGRVTAIDPGIDPATRNFRVRATFDNPGQLLRPGTFARIQAALGEPESVLVLPQSAISFNPYGNSVYVISDAPQGTAGADDEPALIVRQRFIRTGDTRGDLVVVTDGLAAGEQVATSGLLKLRNDAPVVINNRVEPSSELDPAPDNS